jgi:hypothetical protein
VRVCKHHFKWVLRVQDTRLRNLGQARIGNGDVTADGRGAHGKQKTTTAETEQRIDDHLRSFPTEGSHYTLQNEQQYLDAALTASKMWHLYLKKHEPAAYQSLFEPVEDLDEDEDEDEDMDSDAATEGRKKAMAKPGGGGGEDPKPVVTYQRYLNHFHRLGLQIQKLASDTCSACDKAQLRIAESEDGEGKEQLQSAHTAHLELADKSYALRSRDQAKSFERETKAADMPLPFQSVPGVEYLVADFGGNIQLPKLAVGESFYLRKLRLYNYGMYFGSLDQHHFSFWSEAVANKTVQNTHS